MTPDFDFQKIITNIFDEFFFTFKTPKILIPIHLINELSNLLIFHFIRKTNDFFSNLLEHL